MTKLQASLLFVAVLSVCTAAQYWARRQVQRGRLGQRNLRILVPILVGFIVCLGIFLGMTTFGDWVALTPKPIQTGIFVLGLVAGILYACPRKAALAPLLAFGIVFTLDTFRPWILQHVISRAGAWSGFLSILLNLIEILWAFVAYRMLRGLLVRLSD